MNIEEKKYSVTAYSRFEAGEVLILEGTAYGSIYSFTPAKPLPQEVFLNTYRDDPVDATYALVLRETVVVPNTASTDVFVLIPRQGYAKITLDQIGIVSIKPIYRLGPYNFINAG